MKPILNSLALIGLTVVLTACGFQLRGLGDTQFALKELDVSARNAYGQTVSDLERVLSDNGVNVHPGAAYKLIIIREIQDRRTISYTSVARSAEYELISSLDYEIRSADNLLLIGDTASVRKVYLHDENNLIGSDLEAQQLITEMRRDMIQRLVQRLQALTPEHLNELHNSAVIRAEAEAAANRAVQQPQPSPVE